VISLLSAVPPAARAGPVVPGFPHHDAATGSYGRVVRTAAARAGLPGVTLYWLRHSVATELARQGLSSAQLQAAMGWTSIAMATRYVHLTGRDTAGATDRLPWSQSPPPPPPDTATPPRG
jgi:integrase